MAEAKHEREDSIVENGGIVAVSSPFSIYLSLFLFLFDSLSLSDSLLSLILLFPLLLHEEEVGYSRLYDPLEGSESLDRRH